MNHNTTLADKALIFILVFFSILSFVFIKEVIPQGSMVEIEVNGKLEYALPLSIDKTVEMDGAAGKTIVEIKDNRVRIKDSTCNKRLCVHQGWVDKGAVICLPNKVVVRITGAPGGKNNGIRKDLDGITG